MDTRSVELYLGISRRTLYRLVKNGAIPVSRVGRRIRVSKRALDVAVAAGLVW
jgi:excisionase family DNA binding protein